MQKLNFKKISLISCIIFGALFSLLALLRFHHFMMGSFDLAIFDQAVWHYGQLEMPVSTVRGMNILGDHFSPALILLAPLRLLWPSAQALLVGQAFIASFSAYFVFLVLEKKLKNPLSAYLLSITTFFFLGLQYTLDYDFHLISLAILPLSILLYGLFNESKKAYWLGLIFAFLLKEDMAIIIFFIGLYELIALKKKKLGAITMLISAIFFYLESTYLMPFFQDNPAVVKNYIDFYALGNTKAEIIRTSVTQPWIIPQVMLDSPVKINTLVQSHLPFGFLPLLSPLYLFASLPIWLERLLSATQMRWMFEQYYGISLTPFLVIGTGQTINFFSKKITLKIFKLKSVLWMTLIIFVLAIVTAVYNHAPITRLVHPAYYQFSEVEVSMREAVSMVPKLSSVSAQQPFVSHLSGRSEIYWFPDRVEDADFVLLVDSRPATPLSNEERTEQINLLLENNSRELIYEENGVFLFKNK